VGNELEATGATVSLPRLKHPGYTLEDWRSWEGRWELINGVAYDLSQAPGTEHQQVSSKLHLAIGNALEEANRRVGGRGCELFAAPTDVFLEAGVVQPDLLVVCDPAKVSPRGIEGAPDLVVEILREPEHGQQGHGTQALEP
jgi:Uma2 family endonuclease